MDMPDNISHPNSFPSEAFESPDWHREVLEERERFIASGEAKFIDWEQEGGDSQKVL
jgi:hypothetical protein